MTHPVDPSGLGDMLAKTMAAVGKFQAASSGDSEDDAAPLEGHSESEDSMIKVWTQPPGRLARISFDHRVGRMGTEELAEELTKVVNAALADLQEKSANAAGAPDFTGLSEQLKEIQETSAARMNTFTDALVQAQERIAQAGRNR